MVSQDFILAFLKEHPGATARDIMDHLGTPPWERTGMAGQIHTRCKPLIKYGFVNKTKEGQTVRYEAV